VAGVWIFKAAARIAQCTCRQRAPCLSSVVTQRDSLCAINRSTGAHRTTRSFALTAAPSRTNLLSQTTCPGTVLNVVRNAASLEHILPTESAPTS
jgi:hypothetical protein